MERMISDIEEVRKELKIEKWLVMTHSFGGILGINYAVKYANNVEALMLVNSTLDMKESFDYMINKGIELLNIDDKEKYLDKELPV